MLVSHSQTLTGVKARLFACGYAARLLLYLAPTCCSPLALAPLCSSSEESSSSSSTLLSSPNNVRSIRTLPLHSYTVHFALPGRWRNNCRVCPNLTRGGTLLTVSFRDLVSYRDNSLHRVSLCTPQCDFAVFTALAGDELVCCVVCGGCIVLRNSARHRRVSDWMQNVFFLRASSIFFFLQNAFSSFPLGPRSLQTVVTCAWLAKEMLCLKWARTGASAFSHLVARKCPWKEKRYT